MIEATISPIEPGIVLPLFGARDQHLRRISDRFQVAISHRDGQIRVSGEKEGVERAIEIIKQLKLVVERKGQLSPADFDAAVANVARDGDGELLIKEMIDVHEVGKQIRPRTAGQSKYAEAIRKNDLVLAVGPAGTGKTYLAVALAVEALKHQAIRKIVLVRPAVEAGESLGFLPGDLHAKINPYLRPLLDAIHEMIDYDQIRRLMEQDVIEVVPLAYMRGRTLNDSFIILDEAQNTTIPQMKMFLTRMGQGSKIVVSGDISQVDLPKDVRSGLTDALTRLKEIKGVEVVRLSKKDIVRHRLVQEIVMAYEEQGPGKKHEHHRAHRK